jgi:hypothetical protein
VTFEADPEPVWQERDDSIKELLRERDVIYIEKVSHTLWNPYE